MLEFLFTVLPGPPSSPPTNFSHARAQAVAVCLLLRREIIRTTSSSTSFFEPQPSSIAVCLLLRHESTRSSFPLHVVLRN
ncbi:hypothetical protein DY000_02022662 [Brassica cretica]|uniref:Uncharacterized protein n=1 Tax=Brassica cretica TaxID=69181 RepID=A0ABQ7EAH7_BRACR|nr:hypothetical protein DY000_02022662 [Brassica cretica]